MAKRADQPKSVKRRTPRECARIADAILAAAAKRARADEKLGIHWVTLSRAELIRKLARKTAHSPFLSGIGWGAAQRGSTFVLRFDLNNPDQWPYFDGTVGLTAYWCRAGAALDPALSMLRAEPSVGVLAADVPYVGALSGPTTIQMDHLLPAAMPAGRNELCYLLYSVDAFQAGIVYERGSISVLIA